MARSNLTNPHIALILITNIINDNEKYYRFSKRNRKVMVIKENQ
jgi:hypothetical protein